MQVPAREAQNKFLERVFDKKILAERQIAVRGISKVKETVASISVDRRINCWSTNQRLTQIGV